MICEYSIFEATTWNPCSIKLNESGQTIIILGTTRRTSKTNKVFFSKYIKLAYIFPSKAIFDHAMMARLESFWEIRQARNIKIGFILCLS